MATTTTNNNEENGESDYWIRKASGRNGLDSVRLSIPSEVVDRLDVVDGDNVIIRIDENDDVHLEKLSLD